MIRPMAHMTHIRLSSAKEEQTQVVAQLTVLALDAGRNP